MIRIIELILAIVFGLILLGCIAWALGSMMSSIAYRAKSDDDDDEEKEKAD